MAEHSKPIQQVERSYDCVNPLVQCYCIRRDNNAIIQFGLGGYHFV
jgi:hypothetical protein